MRVISANLNGIRSAHKKGFLSYLEQVNADFVCVQELKAQDADLDDQYLKVAGMQAYIHCAEKKGYSGVGIYTKRVPDQVVEGLGIDWIDLEGRYLQLDFGNLSIISLYLPSGSSSEDRQAKKFEFLNVFRPHLDTLAAQGRDFIVCGDWNIAHQEIDLKNWKGNVKNSGFLPEERQWVSDLLATNNWVDVYRALYPEAPGYTWWSNRGQAYANDVGWRIDYQMVSPALASVAKHAHVYKDEKFSDHAPLVVDYEYV